MDAKQRVIYLTIEPLITGARKQISCLSGVMRGGLQEGRQIRRRSNILHVALALPG